MFELFLNKLRDYYAQHRTLLNKIALPVIVVLAILFFWVYGSGDDSVKVDNSVTDGVGYSDNVNNYGSFYDGGSENNEGNDNSSLSDAAKSSASVTQCYVDIGGEVVSPGVYLVKSGSRVFQVIEQAGGLTSEAFTDGINLAEEVCDGEKIIIPSVEDNENNPVKSGDYTASGYNNTANSSANDGRVNINYADVSELETIPGIGPAKAQAIIDYRDTYGFFNSIEDIKQVSGIGDKTFDSIKDHIIV